MTKPGLVVRIHGKDKSEVEVQFDDKTITAQNLLKDLKVGDYVLLNDSLIIQRISEHAAEKMLK